MPPKRPSRVFNFFPLEDRILLSADGPDAGDLAPHPDTETLDMLMEQLSGQDLFGDAIDNDVALGETSDPVESASNDIGNAPIDDATQPLAVIFVDAGVEDADLLLSELQNDADQETQWLVVRLSSDADGISQISDSLDSLSGVDAIHLLSHGDGQGIRLGNTTLSSQSISGYASDLASWAQALDTDADLLIYGCDLAASEPGRELIESLSVLCDCDVAASDDATGHNDLGGDWELEYTTGQIESDIAFSTSAQQSWYQVLGASDVTGIWTGSGPSSASNSLASPITVTANFVEPAGSDITATAGSLTTGTFFSDSYVQGADSLDLIILWDTTPESSGDNASDDAVTTTVTFTFDTAVVDPILHIDRLGGVGGSTSNSSLWTVTTSGATLTKLSGVDHLNVTSNTFYRTPNVTTTANSEAAVNSADGTAAGSIQINGTYTTVTFEISSLGVEGAGGDGLELAWEFAQNDAPVLSGANDFSTINEDAITNSGTLVSALTAGHISDTSGSSSGIAVVNVDNTFGTWEHTTDGGTNWNGIGSVDNSNARLLADDANTSIRFVPNADWNGTISNGITFHAWDQTSGSNGGTADLLASADHSVRDNFDTVSYSGNNGTDGWTNNWQELGESDGESNGNVRVPTTGTVIAGPYMSIQANAVGIGVSRQADLSGATSATVSFTYEQRDNSAGGQMLLEVYDGSSWTTLQTYDIDSSFYSGTVGVFESYDISAYVDTNTEIRFRTTDAASGDTLYMDDFQIAYTTSDVGGGSSAFSSASYSSDITVTPVNDAPEIASWYDNNWAYRKEILVSAGQVSGDLVGFPILVDLNIDGDLASFAQADGDDILFTSGDGTSKLSHEIEVFQSATGELVAWVKTDLSSSQDTRLYMYYGNGAATNQQDAANVWDAGYQGVWHLNDSPTGTAGEIQDSTSNNNNGTTEGSMNGADLVSTQIGNGLDFDEVDDLIRIGNSVSLDSTASAATFEIWVNWDNVADGDHQILMTSSNRFTTGARDGYEWASQGSGNHFYYPEGGTDPNYVLGPSPYTNGVWHHVALTQDFTSKEVEIYVDGTAMSFATDTLATTWTTLADPDDWLWGGNPDRATRYFDGMMDEIRVSNVVRSVDWIQTSYNNQDDPTAFVSVGTAETRYLTLSDISEDDTNPTGDTVATLIASVGGNRITDRDAAAVEGVAVTGVDDTNGTWQYDAGSGWTDFGSVSDSSAVLLDTAAKIRFVPAADYNGPSGNITLRAWDQSDGNPSGSMGVDVSTNGNSTAYSSTIDNATLNVLAVNDAPTTSHVVLTAIAEDSGARTITQAELLSAAGDIEGDSLTATSLAISAGSGTLVDNGDGTWDYTPAANDDTSVSFNYTINDGTDNTAGTATLDITPVNDAPTTSPVVLTAIAEDSGARTITQAELLSATGDIEGDSLTATSLAISAGSGTLVDNGDGTWDYTPAADDDTSVSFSYSITDGTDNVAGTATLDITPVNDAPTTSPVVLTAIAEDSGARTITQAELLSAAGDIEGDSLTATSLAISAGSGTLVDNGDGTWDYTPATDDDTSVSFSYSITDGTDNTAGTATLDITPINDAPTTSPVVLTAIAEDSGARTITQAELLSATGDIEGDSLTATGLTISAGSGTLVDNGDGTWDYTPATNDDTSVSFSYSITDGTNNVAGTATLDITPGNDAPTTSPVVLTAIAEDSGARTITQAELLSAAGDVEGDSLTATGLAISAGSGTLVDNGDGTWDYTPATNDDTSVSFSYSITDGTDNVAGTATLDITPVNDAPTTSPIVLTAIAEDSGARTITQAELLSASGDTEGDSLTATSLAISAGSGTLVDNGDGTWDYTPAANDDTSASFSYSITDGTDSVTGSATLDIAAVNDEEVLSTNTGVTVAEGSTANVIFNTMLETTDVDNTSGQLVYTVDAIPVNGTLYRNGVVLNVNDTFTEADLDAGWISYDHDGSATPSDSFDFTVDDGNGTTTSGTFNWTISNINDAPIETSIEVTPLAYTEDAIPLEITSTLALSDVDDTNLESAIVQISGNYANGQDLLAFTDQNGISGSWDAVTGRLTLTGTATIAQYEAALQSVTYTNTSDNPSTATRTVSFTVNDGDVNSNTQTRDIIIAATNDDPTGAGLPTDVAVTEDVSSNVDLSALNLSDPDDNGGNLTVTLITSSGGNLSAGSAGGVTVGGSGSGSITLNGTLADLNTFLDTPANVQYLHGAPNTFGNDADTIQVVVNDGGNTGSGGGLDQTIGTVNVDITAVNDASAVAVNIGLTVAEGSIATAITPAMLSAADVDDSGSGLTYTVTDATDNGTLTLAGFGSLGLGATFTQADLANGDVTYSHDDSETTSDSFGFSLADGGEDGVIPVTGTFHLVVTPVNDNSISVITDSDLATNTVAEDAAVGTLVGVTALASDADSVASVTYSLDDSAGGRFAIDGASGLVTVAGTLDFESSASENITVRATSSDGSTTTEVFAISVTNVNEAPAATGESFTVFPGQTLSVEAAGVIFNDSDIDGDSLALILVTPPSSGTFSLQPGGSFTYTPNVNFFGQDSFFYQLTDGSLTSNTVQVTIDVPLAAPVTAPASTQTSTDSSEPSTPPGTSDSSDATDASAPGDSSISSDLSEPANASDAPANPVMLVATPPTSQTPDSPVDELAGEGSGESIDGRLRELGLGPGEEQVLGFLSGSVQTAGTASSYSPELADLERLLKEDLAQAIVWTQWDDNQPTEDTPMMAYAGLAGAGMSMFSIGYVFWALRGGALMTVFASSLPAWRFIDPIAMLSAYQTSQLKSDEGLDGLLSRKN